MNDKKKKKTKFIERKHFRALKELLILCQGNGIIMGMLAKHIFEDVENTTQIVQELATWTAKQLEI